MMKKVLVLGMAVATLLCGCGKTEMVEQDITEETVEVTENDIRKTEGFKTLYPVLKTIIKGL